MNSIKTLMAVLLVGLAFLATLAVAGSVMGTADKGAPFLQAMAVVPLVLLGVWTVIFALMRGASGQALADALVVAIVFMLGGTMIASGHWGPSLGLALMGIALVMPRILGRTGTDG